ncbi:hypothetical protein HY410_00360 [Candidatus Gottesmanbacteria bacterium]|nr:hypothetical protein [Candidatus Gottesmanbacteria bacterium]
MKRKLQKVSPLAILVLLLAAIGLSPSAAAAKTVTVDPYGIVHTSENGEILGRSDNQGRGLENRSDSSRSESSSQRNPDINEPNRGSSESQTQQSQSAPEPGRGKGLLRLAPSGETDSSTIVINPPDDQDDIVIRASGSASQVIRNKIFAQTHFPLMVNLETNELMVTTPKGTKIVTVLPDKAVQNMLAANVLDQLGGKGGLLWLANQATPSATPIATPSAEPSPTGEASASGTPTATPAEVVESQTGEQIVLTEQADGTLVYRIPGFKNKKFLGIFAVSLARIAVVSAQTGELIAIEQNFLSRILDTLSQ